MKPSDAFLLDRRVAQRHVDKGLLSQEDFDKSLADLPDAGLNSGTTSIPIVKVAARKNLGPRPVAPPPVDENLYDLDDDDGDDD